jgi:hypothetical protein
MKLSDLIETEVKNKPPRIVLHGIHGIGKTKFAAHAPKPIFILTEDGLDEIKKSVDFEIASFPLAKNYDSVTEYIRMLIEDDHDFKTVVLDTADWLEKLIWSKVCEDHGVSSIEDIGWAKGYKFAMRHWGKIIDGFNRLRKRGMAIVVLAHNEIKRFNPPDGEGYDRYQIKLHHTAAETLEEWADCVLFANYQTYVDVKSKKVVNAANPTRVIYTSDRPAWRAKTRYALPDTLPLDFNALLDGIKNHGKNAE